ncbi:hypothetical protein ACFMQL_06650 [Nonomuraea fastidiosa]
MIVPPMVSAAASRAGTAVPGAVGSGSPSRIAPASTDVTGSMTWTPA